MGDGLYAIQGRRWRHACGLSKDSEMGVQPFYFTCVENSYDGYLSLIWMELAEGLPVRLGPQLGLQSSSHVPYRVCGEKALSRAEYSGHDNVNHPINCTRILLLPIKWRPKALAHTGSSNPMLRLVSYNVGNRKSLANDLSLDHRKVRVETMQHLCQS